MPPSTWRFDAIGTDWSIDSDDVIGAADRAAVMTLIARFDRAWSRFRADSVVAGIAPGGVVPAPEDTAAMLSLYAELSAATGGAVSPLIGRSLEALGYDAAYSMHADTPVAAPAWRDVLTWDESLQLTAPAVIDVGAVGKGRLVDRVFDLLRTHAGLVVDASGDLRASDRSLRVALEHPYDPRRAIGVATITNAALCASATNRRSWGDGLHHVLDARTGVPVRTVAATWVVHPEAMIADGIATALFFDGGPEIAAAHEASWVRMLTDGRVEYRGNETQWELFT